LSFKVSQSTGVAAIKEASQCFPVDVPPIEIHQGLLKEEQAEYAGGGKVWPSADELRDMEEVREIPAQGF